MNSKERILAAWDGRPVDHVPLSAWCFGLLAPENLRWNQDGADAPYWYSLRMEHLHTLPQPWGLQDDFQRLLAWRSLGVDDVLDVSVPWSVEPSVLIQDTREEYQGQELLVREYGTPSGRLEHKVRQTDEVQPGWVVQPDCVPLFEDYNIPRAIKHAVAGPADIPPIRHLYAAPDAEARTWFANRMAKVGAFAREHHVPVQAWSAFGIDGVVWLTGAEGAVMLAMDAPDRFAELLRIVAEADLARTRLAAEDPGVDMVVARGWYSSTDFWSPRLFDRYIYPYIAKLADVAHTCGKRFAYTMTTGVEKLGPRLADAGVDVLYFVDPVQDAVSLERVRDLLADRMTLVGGINALTLASGDAQRIRSEVQQALRVLGPTQRFILQPVDALFPDTPWEGVVEMIEAWHEYR